MRIVLVIPCYNEANRLQILKFKDHPGLFYVFVNDGSSDGTEEMIKQSLGDNIRLFNLEQNMGKAEAVRQGMREACRLFPDAEWIGFWDADLATPLSQVEYMVSYLEIQHQKFTAIFASRLMRLGSDIKRDPKRHILGRVFVTLSSLLLDLHAYDSQCGAKIFRPEVINALFAEKFISKWFFDLEIILRMRQRNLKALECPIQEWVDVDGSKIHPLRDSIRGLWEICKMRKFYGKN